MNMKRKINLVGVSISIFISLNLFFVFIPEKGLSQQKYEWRLQSAWLTPATQEPLRAFAENVKKETKGIIDIKVYDANQLVKIMAIPSAVQSGAIEMGCSAGPYLAGIIPEGDVEFGLPFSWRTWEEAWEAWTKYGLRDKIREAYAEKGLYLLTIQPASEYVLMSVKPVYKVEDLKGLKVRSTGMVPKIIAKFGAVPTMVPGAEQYVALQRGTVDATIYPYFVLEDYKLKEIVKYVIFPSFISPPTTNVFINLKVWNSLPKELKDTIERLSSTYQSDMQKRYKEEGRVALENFQKIGGKIVELPDSEVKKLRKVSVEEWEALGAKSPRLKALVDTMKRFMADKGISY
jgi:TRAP-type C4-dicarboxylate transport system substrate-binding protein